MENKGRESTGRDRGKFAKGVSGNKAGRPKGSLNKWTLMLQEELQKDAELYIQKLKADALAGKPYAMKLVMQYLFGPPGRHVEIEPRELKKAEDMTQHGSDVIAMVAEGELTVEQGAGYLELMAHQRKTLEALEFETRLVELEHKEWEREQQEKEDREWRE